MKLADPPRNAVSLCAAAVIALTKSQVALLQAKQYYIYGSAGYYDSILARQITPGNAGAPPEVIGLDLYNYKAATFRGTPDQWRDTCGSGQHGPGYSTSPDEMLSVLTATYLLPPFTDANDSVVSGLDNYHDASIIGRIVNCLDGTTYYRSDQQHRKQLFYRAFFSLVCAALPSRDTESLGAFPGCSRISAPCFPS